MTLWKKSWSKKTKIFVFLGYIGAIGIIVDIISPDFSISKIIKNQFSDNKIFSHRDTSFKILILPFNKISGESDFKIGLAIKNRLKDLNDAENLNLKVDYFKYSNIENIEDSAVYLMKYHNADQIIYGAYKEGDCNRDLDQICINYNIDEKWSFDSIQNKNILTDYQFASLDDIEEGMLQGDIDFIIYWIAGLSAYNQERYESSIKKFQHIVHELRIDNKKVYNKLAYAFHKVNLIDSSEYYNEKILSISYDNKDGSYFITSLNNLSANYIANGKYDKALRNLLEAVRINEDFCDNQHNSTGIIYDNLALIYDLMEDHEKAVYYGTLGLQYHNLKKDNEKRIIVSCNNLGLYYNALNKYEKSLEYFIIAEKTHRKIYKLADTIRVRLYWAIGVNYNNLNMYNESIIHFNKAISTINKLNKNNYDIKLLGLIFKDISIPHSKLGHNLKAIEYISKSNDILLNCSKLDSTSLSLNFMNLATIYKNKGIDSLALKNDLKSLKYYSKKNQIDQKYVDLNYYIAGNYFDLSEYKTALKYYSEAYKTFNKINSLDFSYAAQLNNDLGATYQKLGKYHESISYFKNSINYINNSDTINLINRINTYQNIAQSYYLLNNKDSSIYWCNKSIQILAKININELDNNSQIIIGGICLSLSTIYNFSHDIDKAKVYISMAIDIYKRNLSKNHPLLVHSVQFKNEIKN